VRVNVSNSSMLEREGGVRVNVVIPTSMGPGPVERSLCYSRFTVGRRGEHATVIHCMNIYEQRGPYTGARASLSSTRFTVGRCCKWSSYVTRMLKEAHIQGLGAPYRQHPFHCWRRVPVTNLRTVSERKVRFC